MKELLVTACAVAALCGTAFAQAPAEKDKSAPAAKSDTSAQPAQPSGSQATQPSAQPPADKSGASADQGAKPMDKTASPAETKPGGSTAQKDAGEKQAPSSTTAAAPASGAEVMFYTVKPADMQASNLMGATVYNANDESIGDIEDIIFDEQHAVRAVVIGVGGFLGVGEHDVAVEMSAIEIMDQTGSDEVRIVLNTTKEDLENAPAVKLEDEGSQAASGKSGETAGSAGTTGAGTDGAPKSDAAKQPEDASKSGGKSESMDTSKSGAK